MKEVHLGDLMQSNMTTLQLMFTCGLSVMFHVKEEAVTLIKPVGKKNKL